MEFPGYCRITYRSNFDTGSYELLDLGNGGTVSDCSRGTSLITASAPYASFHDYRRELGVHINLYGFNRAYPYTGITFDTGFVMNFE